MVQGFGDLSLRALGFGHWGAGSRNKRLEAWLELPQEALHASEFHTIRVDVTPPDTPIATNPAISEPGESSEPSKTLQDTH